MKDFGDFQIKPNNNGILIGEKISINKIININIVVETFKISESKFEGKGKRLDLQIIFNGDHRVIFISSKNLIDMIERVPKDSFPFTARIIKEDSGSLVFAAASK
jgi:hypothetical protein